MHPSHYCIWVCHSCMWTQQKKKSESLYDLIHPPETLIMIQHASPLVLYTAPLLLAPAEH